MPNYDFLCPECQHKFSVSVPIREREQVCCPVCQNPHVKQRFTSFFFAKPGSGESGGSCSRSSCSGCPGC